MLRPFAIRLCIMFFPTVDVYKRQVYHEGGGLEQQFEYLAEEVADALLHVVHSPVEDVYKRQARDKWLNAKKGKEDRL